MFHGTEKWRYERFSELSKFVDGQTVVSREEEATQFPNRIPTIAAQHIGRQADSYFVWIFHCLVTVWWMCLCGHRTAACLERAAIAVVNVPSIGTRAREEKKTELFKLYSQHCH